MAFFTLHTLRNQWNTFTNRPDFVWFLYGYHVLFIGLAYVYRVERGISDAHLYWGYTTDLLSQSWWEYAHFGTDFMLLLTYPFVYLGFPFWFGFFLFGTLGFLGIWNWIRWLQLEIGTSILYKGWSLLPFLYFWPNLHFWTAGLGKEALVFWALATIFLKVSQRQYRSVVFGVAVVVLVALRPHVALFLSAAFLIVQLFRKELSLSKRVIGFGVSLPLIAGLVYVVLQLSKIRYIDWNRIQRFNQGSVLSFEDSGSYVPMLEYSRFYQWVSLNFRPFLWEAHSVFSFFAALDNVVLLLFQLLGLYLFVRYYRLISLTLTLKTALVFSLICGCIYIFRYANLGIFMRTKIMWMPFEMGFIGYLVERVVRRR